MEELFIRIETYRRRCDDFQDRCPEKSRNWDEEEPESETDPPDEVFFDADREVISPEPFDEDPPQAMKPVRYTVAPDNPWYFDLDGVVFSRETGLLVLFPPGKGEEYAVPADDRITGIGEYAFAGSELLKRIDFGSRIRYIGEAAFAGCTALQEVSVPAGVRYLGNRVFCGCKSLKKADINCRTGSIPDELFAGDKSLCAVRIPDRVISVGFDAFKGCKALKSVKPSGAGPRDTGVILPDGLVEIRQEAFSGCVSVRSVSLPESGRIRLERYAFSGCTSLKTFRAGGVDNYGDKCFQDCSGLREFAFGGGTRWIGREIFSGAVCLQKIRFRCAPDFRCDDRTLPMGPEYDAVAELYLQTPDPYGCPPVFQACIREIAGGAAVLEESRRTAIRILKEKRRENFWWFLREPGLLTWVLREKIPDCDDCAELLMMAETELPEDAEEIHAWMERSLSADERAAVISRREEIEQEYRKEEAARRRERAKRRRLMKDLRDQLPGEMKKYRKIPIEELDLPVLLYECLKEYGVDTVEDALAISGDELLEMKDLGPRGIYEVQKSLRKFTGWNEVGRSLA